MHLQKNSKVINLIIAFANIFAAALVNYYEELRQSNDFNQLEKDKFRRTIRDLSEYLRLFSIEHPKFKPEVLEEVQLEIDEIIQKEIKEEVSENRRYLVTCYMYSKLVDNLFKTYLQFCKTNKYEEEFTKKALVSLNNSLEYIDIQKIEKSIFNKIKESVYEYIRESTTSNS